MIKLYFVSGPSRSTICEKKYVELLIQAMCLESGDDEEEYTATSLENPKCTMVDDQSFIVAPDHLRYTEVEEFANGAATFAAAKPGSMIAVPFDLIASACSAIDKKRDAPKTLAELRRYTTGDLSCAALAAAPQAPAAVELVAWPTGVAQFTKKPVTISAIQWTGANLREVIAFTDRLPDTRTTQAQMAWDD